MPKEELWSGLSVGAIRKKKLSLFFPLIFLCVYVKIFTLRFY